MYKVNSVSDFVVYYTNKKAKYISNLKLQKILYFIQEEYILTKDSPCFKEDIKAWGFGPVVPEIYRKYSGYPGPLILNISEEKIENIKEEDRKEIARIVDSYNKYSDEELMGIIKEESPWAKLFDKKGEATITPEAIKEYYREE